MEKLLSTLVVTVLLVMPVILHAGTEPEQGRSPVPVSGQTSSENGKKAFAWEEFNQLTLENSDRAGSYQTRWVYELAENGDLKITVDERHGAESRSGEVMLIGGRALLIKGPKLDADQRLDFIDGPVLMCQLAINLLHYAFNQGPRLVTGAMPFELTEKTRTVIIASPHSTSYFSPPWKLTGSAQPRGSGIGFTQVFSFKREPGDKNDAELLFNGVWNHADAAPRFPDSLPLAGWDIALIDPATQNVANDASCCKKDGAGFRTLGELRKHISTMPQGSPPDEPEIEK